LFIYSEEVKKELPKESHDFIKIDQDVKEILTFGKSKNNIFEFSNTEKNG